MRRLHVLIALSAGLVVGAAGLVAAVPALADGAKVIADCSSHARLTQQYSVADLQNALSTMPADVKQYGNCYDVISRALLSHAGGASGSGQGSGGVSTPLIVVLVLLGLTAAGYGAVVVSRRRR
jgi:hypothetical protein